MAGKKRGEEEEGGEKEKKEKGGGVLSLIEKKFESLYIDLSSLRGGLKGEGGKGRRKGIPISWTTFLLERTRRERACHKTRRGGK